MLKVFMMSRPHWWISLVVVSAVLCLSSTQAWAQRTEYTDEASFMSALATLGYVVVKEDFEDPDIWGVLQGYASAPDATNLGVTWTGFAGNVTLTGNANHGVPGAWGLISSPHGLPADGFGGTGEQTIFALGAWVRTFTPPPGSDTFLFLDGDMINFIERKISIDFQFMGVIDTNGFTNFQFSTQAVAPGDPGKQLFVDDVTFAFSAAPSVGTPGIRWTNPAGGIYSTGPNWQAGIKPLAGENALFDLVSLMPYTLSFDQNETASQFVIADDKVALDHGGFTYDLTKNNAMKESIIVAELPGTTGSLAIGNGILSGVNAVVGHSRTTTADMTVNGNASLSLSGDLRIGSGGSATLDILPGASVSSASSVIGHLGGSGVATLAGPAATWDITGALTMAFPGNATLSVSSGGVLTAGSLAASVSGTNAAVTVSDPGSALSLNGAMFIGQGGPASLTVANGAQVVASSLSCAQGADASVNILDGSLSLNSMSVGESPGTGTVTVAGNTASLTSTNNIMLASSGPATMTVTGGATVTSFNSDIAADADAMASLHGVGTAWNQGGTMTLGVGVLGGVSVTPPLPTRTGTMIVDTGATLNTGVAFLGFGTDARGVLTIDGPGSSWTSGQNNIIGYYGEGELNVTNGATISTGQTMIGRFGGTGVVNMDGTTWTCTSGMWVGFQNNASLFSPIGTGVLNVINGATVTAPNLGVATRWTSDGTVNISGVGSQLMTTVSDVSLSFLFSASVPGSQLRSTARVNVGAGGTLTSGAAVRVWDGTLDLNGGTVNAATTCELTFGTLSGFGQVNADVVNTDGFVSPGTPTGILNVNGSFTQTANGTVSVEIGGLLAGTSFDQLNMTGTAALAGTLDVALINGFTPAPGDMFDILTAGAVSGTFDVEVLPTLGGGMSFNVNYSDPTKVKLEVVAIPGFGDINCDGALDINDVQAMVNVLLLVDTVPCHVSAADMNVDGIVDGGDIQSFLQILLGP